MTNAILERGRDLKSASVFGDDHALIPITLHASLTARLDNLGPAKILAQLGAIFGRRFSVAALREISPAERTGEFDGQIDRLMQSGLFVVRDNRGGKTLSFRHALLQEAAYESLLRANRGRLHGAGLQALEKLYPTRLDALAETLGMHAERAEDWNRAARYLSSAFTKATARYANREAASLYHRAANALSRLADKPAIGAAIDLRLHAFSVFQALGEIETLIEIVEQAERLAKEIKDERRSAAAAAQSAFGLWMTGKHRAALARAEESHAIAVSLQEFPLILVAQYNLASIHYLLGNVTNAVALHRKTIDMLPGPLAAKRFGWQAAPGLISRAFLSAYLIDLGQFEQAKDVLEEAKTILQSVNQPFSRVVVQAALGLYYLRRRQLDEATCLLREAFDLSESAEVLTMSALVAAWLGEALATAGLVADGLAVVEDAVARKSYRFCPNSEKHLRLSLAEILLLMGDLKRARQQAALALALTAESEEVVYHAIGLKLDADISVAMGDYAGAEASYRSALAVAEERDCRLLQAQCKQGLGNCNRQRRLARPRLPPGRCFGG